MTDTVVIKIDDYKYSYAGQIYKERSDIRLEGEVYAPEGTEIDWEGLLPKEVGEISLRDGYKVDIDTFWDRGWNESREWIFGDMWDRDRRLPKDVMCVLDDEQKTMKLVWWIKVNLKNIQHSDPERAQQIFASHSAYKSPSTRI